MTRPGAGRPGTSGGDLSVQGVEQFADLAKALKTADKVYRKELRIGLNRATKPLKEGVKEDLSSYMPSGFTPVLARTLKLATRVGLGRFPSVRITASAKGRRVKRRITAMNKGILRHPLWGNRGWWFNTGIKPGFFDKPIEKRADEVRDQIMHVVDGINEKIKDAL